jgi:Restriction endonuclease
MIRPDMAKRRRRRNDDVLAELVFFAIQLAFVLVFMVMLLAFLVMACSTDVAAKLGARIRGERRDWQFTARYGRWLRSRSWAMKLLGPPPLRVQALAELTALSPTGFEHACASLLRDLGYVNVKQRGGSGDLGVDIEGRDPHGLRVAVQCKRYSNGNRVGSPDVQRFIGMARLHHGAQRAIIMTTSSFTPAAVSLAQQHDIELVDAAELSKLVEEQKRRRMKASVGSQARC